MGTLIEQSLIDYEHLVHTMAMKRKLGLTSDDEWFEWIMSEDTLWKIIKEKRDKVVPHDFLQPLTKEECYEGNN